MSLHRLAYQTALQFPEVTCTQPFGDGCDVFKVMDKVFMLNFHLEGQAAINLKVIPDDGAMLRDKAILELLYSSGLRLAEVQGLRIKDIDFNRQLLRITGKGNKTRVVPFGSKARDAVMKWLQVYPLWHGDFVPDAHVFITQKGNPLGARQIENRVKLQALRAGVNVDLHPHLLRHCFASHMLSNSRDLRAVQEMLGHSNLTTTQIYTHVDFDHLAQVYDQAHPRAQVKKS